MKRPLPSVIASLALLLLAGTLCLFWSLDRAATTGRSGEYAAAAAAWHRLGRLFPGSAGIAFNGGVASFRQRDYRAAADYFDRATRGDDPAVTAAAYYNLGNSLVRQGDELSLSGRPGAAECYRQAGEEYDRALRLDGTDADARFNRDVVRRRLLALSPAPAGQAGPNAAAGRQKEGGAKDGRNGKNPGQGKDNAAAAPRAASGDRSSGRTGKQAAGDGRNGAGTPQPLGMTRRDAEALLREHRNVGGATAIFRDGGRSDGAAPVLKDW